jgi:choline monooxygenase
MLIHQSRLPHVLEPRCYWSTEQHELELQAVFRPAWHLVGSASELSRPGDFKTFELLGQPVQLRRVENQWHAYSNVCVHRHCLLTSVPSGNSPKLRCQYHGWEYDQQGRTAHIPEPKNFAPWDRDANRLTKYRVETCGDLLFLCFEPDSPSLDESLGEGYETLKRLFSAPWRQAHAWSTDVEANWKVPIENSLEGYHIPCVHPQTFKVAPTPERIHHVLGPRATSYTTPSVAPSRVESLLFAIEDVLLRALGRTSSKSYTHHHFFPNVLVSVTDMLSLGLVVTPLGPARSRIDVRLFCYQPDGKNLLLRTGCSLWARLNRAISRMVLSEDFAIYPDIQRGLAASTHPGCLGAIEERVHAFQTYVQAQCNAEVATSR